eukprot:563981_1
MSEADTIDIPIHLPLIKILWQQGVLNAFGLKEVQKMVLNKAHHHLISPPLLRLVESLKQIELDHHNCAQEEKKDNDDDDAHPILSITEQIKSFQSAIRPLIRRAIQLSHTAQRSQRTQLKQCTQHDVLNALADNIILPRNIVYLIEQAIYNGRQNDDKTIQFNPDNTLSIADCYSFVRCTEQQQLPMFDNVLADELSLYNECRSSLADELSIIQSIFEHVVVEVDTFPILIQLCLSSSHGLAKLYLTFLCPLDYPHRGCIKSSIYLSGPSAFASDNQIWSELQLPLQQMARDAMGDAHLFDIIQFAKEWIERFELRYNDKMKQKEANHCEYIELRNALGLIADEETINKVNQTKIWIKNGSSNIYDIDKTYVWFIKRREIKRKAMEKKEEKVRHKQCYSGHEIDQMIRKLIEIMSNKWKCSGAMAKQKLSQSLWNYDRNMMKQNDESCDVETAALVLPLTAEFECPVCLELRCMFGAMKLSCEHMICVECLSNYIANQINNGIICIKCPQFECKALLSDAVVHILSDHISYKRYRQFIRNSLLETGKDWSFCPNPSCSSAIHHRSPNPLLLCGCGIPLCSQCVSKFHWPLTCRENKQWSSKCNAKIKLRDPNLPDLPKFEGQKFEMMVKTKACPRCKTQWEKNGGCNHILCRKCEYHFCWVCLKEFNQSTHDSFYECGVGIVASTQSNTITMEQPTEAYLEAYKRTLEQRKQMRQQHEKKMASQIQRKLRIKRAIQHERASIFLAEKYFAKKKRCRGLLRNIILCTQQQQNGLNIDFVYQLISRLIQTHLLLSRAYKYISYHRIKENEMVCCIANSLQHVAFKLDAMFQQPKVYLPYQQLKWKWHDLAFYIDFFTQEVCKINEAKKTSKSNHKKSANPFMKVSNHQY